MTLAFGSGLKCFIEIKEKRKAGDVGARLQVNRAQ